jgi:translation initiation factor 3 subunit B
MAPSAFSPRPSRDSASDHGDDGDDEDFEAEPQLDTSMKHAIIVDGLPVVPESKREKLVNVVRKFFSQVGTIIDGGLDMPQGPGGDSLGFAFIEFESEAEATAAIQKANGYKLDKSHTFIVNSFEDHKKFMAVPDVEQEYVPPPFVPGESLTNWLEDGYGRDQYVLRYNDETEIWWNDPGKPNQQPSHARHNWSDTYVSWSPKGTYLATFHRLGIMLWGGPSWKKLLKINHGGVKLIDFSPCEQFLVTWSPESDQSNALIVWDIKTGAKCRAFQGAKQGFDIEWPAFRWSHDDQFFARIGDDCIYVYESASMKLIKDKADKRSSVKVEGVRQFFWSPTDNMVSLWIPEYENNPAKVILMELPTRTELSQKNLFNVADLRMDWHPQGHFLCVKVDKHSKSKKTLNSVFELFRIRDKGVPVEVSEFDKDTAVIAFAWEPKGIRYGIIHGVAGGQRTDVSFYTMGSKYNGKVSLVKTLEKKACSTLWWSPVGSIIVLANLKGTAGNLEWVDVNQCMTIGESEHFMCSDIEWDPTGRFIATSVSHWRHQMENGFIIWSSHGRELGHEKKERFFNFLWRPRPKSLLTEEKEKDVRKNLRDYSAKYEEEDARARAGLDADLLAARVEKHKAFEQFLRIKSKEYQEMKAKRVELRGGVESDNESDYTIIEEEEREMIETTEEIIDDGEEIEIGDD